LQTNEPAIEPLFEARSNNDVFRLMAKGMRFEPQLFEVTDEQLAAESLDTGLSPALFPPRDGFLGIGLERLRQEGPVRLNVPEDYAPFAQGGFGTPSGKCEFYSATLAERGIDPLPTYTPPHEDPLSQSGLAKRYPLQMLSPPHPNFLNTTFVNVDSLRAAAKEPHLEIHPRDAATRGIQDGQWVRVFNDRGEFRARARVGETVRPGVVVTLGTWWSRYTPDHVNCNVTTSTQLTDLGAGATFYDNLVDVKPVDPS
jgi:anaerobic selenocysteine-containing dehydrogenase